MTGECARTVGVVVIGRNEGDRLKRCLRSVVDLAEEAVYVDSGSTDDSVELARSSGVDVVELDMSEPFTMARGRNAGLERLMQRCPHISYIQFVDGDCEVVEGWIGRAREFLDTHARSAVVCGRRRERHPEVSVYNRLCDMEWDTPIGDAKACGGDAMMRVSALRESGSYSPHMIAGEEAELCLRIRRAGWKITRLDAEMTLHDAAMSNFRQWWRRAVRTGHAYAEGAAMHGRSRERHNVRKVLSATLWGLLMPGMIIGSAVVALAWNPWAWCAAGILVGGHGLLLWRVCRRSRRRGLSARDALLYTGFCTLSKYPNVAGIFRYALNRVRKRRSTLIEYKDTQDRTAALR